MAGTIVADWEMNLIQSNVNTDDLTNRVKYIRQLLNHFWKWFYNEYTVALPERMIYDKAGRSSDKLVIGNVVVIKNNTTTPRSKWKNERVKSLIKGWDNIVRGVVLTSSTNGKLIDISRPLQKLILFEVCDDSNFEPAHKKQQIVISVRPRRNTCQNWWTSEKNYCYEMMWLFSENYYVFMETIYATDVHEVML